MVAISFMKQFVEEVENGKKRQTIRQKTKAFTGCTLQLYTGMRTKGVQKLAEAVCTSVTRVILMKTLAQPIGNTAFVGKVPLDEFAQRDGFKTYEQMWDFFKDRANDQGEFHGFLIKW